MVEEFVILFIPKIIQPFERSILMPLPDRIVQRINSHPWPKQVGETRLVSPYSFGRGTIECDYEYPNGKILDFQLWDAETPKDRASIVLPVTEDGRVIVVVQYCHGAGGPVVELPGGVPNSDNEPDDEVARREVEEETGFQVGELVDLGSVYWEPHYKTLAFSAFLAKDCRKVRPARPDESESILVETLTWDEWMAVCRDPNLVRDSKSLTVTFLAMPNLGKL